MGRKKLVLSTAESHAHFCLPVSLSLSLSIVPVSVHCPGEGSMCEWVGGTRVRGACVGTRREAWEREVCEGKK